MKRITRKLTGICCALCLVTQMTGCTSIDKENISYNDESSNSSVQSDTLNGDASNDDTSSDDMSLDNSPDKESSENGSTASGDDNSSIDDSFPASTSDFEQYEHYVEDNAQAYASYSSQNPQYEASQVITYVNIGLNRDFYTDVKVIENPDDLLVLVNKYNALPDDYEPSDLALLPSDICTPDRNLYLRSEAADAFVLLAEAASNDGYTILAHSTYRSRSYQKMLYDNYAASDGAANADTYSARPRHSEHETGLAVDVRTDLVNYNKFGTTDAYQWMLNNAHKYGYVLHYIEGTQWITGYMTEEWHYRYVGVEVADKIHDLGITFDEYYETYLNK